MRDMQPSYAMVGLEVAIGLPSCTLVRGRTYEDGRAIGAWRYSMTRYHPAPATAVTYSLRWFMAIRHGL